LFHFVFFTFLFLAGVSTGGSLADIVLVGEMRLLVVAGKNIIEIEWRLIGSNVRLECLLSGLKMSTINE
jgi:hypothetical protein